MHATWYVTEGGDAVDPAECSRKNGVLTHKSGAKIAMRFPDCPRSRSVDTDEEAAKSKPKPTQVMTEARDLTSDTPKRTYKTRESKAD